ncbi:MAG: SMI1/KNR4 family protein [Ardenticatenaceae bacterium]
MTTSNLLDHRLKKEYTMMGMTPEALIIKLNQAITPAQQAEYFAPGATDEQIQSFREALGPISEQLPECFYAFYRWHNGSKVDRYDAPRKRGEVPFHNNKPLLSLDDIARSFQTWKKLAQEGHFSHYVDGAWWDPAWVPYIETEWYVQVIDTRGSFGGQPGQILGFDYKSADDRFIFCSSFDYWLSWMLKLIEVDLWRPGELSDEEESPKNKRYLTSGEQQRASNMMHTLNPGHPWVAELHRYRQAAAENLPNPHWGELEETIKRDELANLQRLIEEKRIGMSEQNAHSKKNHTPLHLAAQNYAWQSALWLVKQGADLNIKDAYGFTPLRGLIINLNRRVGRPNIAQAEPILAIFDAASERAHPLPVERLASAAIELNNADLLAYALQHGCSPNTIPRFSDYPLLYKTVEESWFAGYEQLLRAGADPAELDEDGPTLSKYIQEQLDRCLDALSGYQTVKEGWVAGYEQLRRAGADPFQLDQDGLTVSEYIEKQLDQRLNALIDSPHDEQQKQKLISLVDFFRAEGRLDDFLAQVYRHAEAETQFGLPLDDNERYDGLSAIANVLPRIDPDLVTPVCFNYAEVMIELLQNERYGQMLDFLDKRIGVQYSPALLYLRACVLHALKRNNEAQACQRELIQVIQENLDKWLSDEDDLRFIIFNESRYARFNLIALKVLECLPLTFDANNTSWEEDLLWARGEILQQRGRYDEVLTLTEQYLTMRQSAHICKLRGTLLRRLQRFAEALNCYLRALEIGYDDDGDFHRYMTRGTVIQWASELNETALARRHYELFDEEYLTPAFEQGESESWRREKMEHLAYIDLPAALEGYRQLLQDYPHSNRIRYEFGKMLRRAGKPEAEISLWQEHLSQQPEHIDAREHIALLFNHHSQHEEAIVHMKQALALGSTELGFVWSVLGDSQYKLGQIDASIHSLQQALTHYEEESDQQMEIRLDLAFAYRANNQADAALAIAENAWHYWQQKAEDYPNDPNSAEQWLRACVVWRQPEHTLAALKNLLLLIPEKGQAYLEWLQDDPDMQFVREQQACREIIFWLTFKFFN